MTPDFVVTHLASHLSGGAGVALLRSHLALRQSDVDSRVILRSSPDASVPLTDVGSATRPGLAERLALKAGLRLDPGERMLHRLETARPAKIPAGSYELFSPPFSRAHPERHPWLSQSSVLNLHWVSDFIDWPAFFGAVQKPVVFTLHDQQPYLGGLHYAADAEANPWLAPLESQAREIKRRSIAGLRAAVIGNSVWNTRAAASAGFFPPGTSFHTVYYALDTDAYAPRAKAHAKTLLGLPADHLVIGFACDDLGNRRKGFDVLMAALRELSGRCSTVSLLSFGRPPPPELADLVPLPWQHLGFIDADPVKAAAYSAMDVFVVPSRAEAFGQTAIEAMACGTPVVVSDTGGLREAVDEGRCGVLVPPERPDLLREAVEGLLDSPERRQSLAEVARTHVVTRHDRRRHAGQYLSIYESLLNTGPHRPLH